LAGWRKIDPPLSRLPLPYEVVALLASHALDHNMIQEGLMMLVCFECYLRPGEVCKLRVMDLAPPVSKRKGVKQAWSLILHPIELGVASKAAEFDETVVFDLPEFAVIAETIYRVMRLDRRPKNQLLFSSTVEKMNGAMQKAVDKYSLEPLGVAHPYRLRHVPAEILPEN